MVGQGNPGRLGTIDLAVGALHDAPGKEILVGPQRDPIFAMLAALNVRENYLERTVAKGLEDEYVEGEERAHKHPLIGAVLFENFAGIEDFLSHDLCFKRQSLKKLEARILKEQSKDGGYIISYPQDGSDTLKVSTRKDAVTITRRSIVHAHNEREKPEHRVKTFGELYARCLPSDFLILDSNRKISDEERYNIGTKTQAAFAAAQISGKKSYVLKQTVIDGTGVGKVALFDESGLRAEFFLYRQSREDIECRYGQLTNEEAYTYINPRQHVVGILRTYGDDKFSEARKEFVITPQELGFSPEDISLYIPSVPDANDSAIERSGAHLRTSNTLRNPDTSAGEDLYTTAELG